MTGVSMTEREREIARLEKQAMLALGYDREEFKEAMWQLVAVAGSVYALEFAKQQKALCEAEMLQRGMRIPGLLQ
jgi:hypothetical protein